MNARFILRGQYDGAGVIPIERVCKDYFSHLTLGMLARKIPLGDIKLPIIRIDGLSQKWRRASERPCELGRCASRSGSERAEK